MVGLGDELYGFTGLGAEGGGVYDLLADTGDFGGERAFWFQVIPEAMDHVLDGVLEGWGDGVDGEVMTFGVLLILDSDGGFVVVAGDGAGGAFEDEAAFGLGLVGPGVGERAPAGFELGESRGVACDGDAMFIDFEAA
ncbi:MAG: hypothetical protein RI897_4179 [Verrucomicrobiota bacterium]